MAYGASTLTPYLDSYLPSYSDTASAGGAGLSSGGGATGLDTLTAALEIAQNLAKIEKPSPYATQNPTFTELYMGGSSFEPYSADAALDKAIKPTAAAYASSFIPYVGPFISPFVKVGLDAAFTPGLPHNDPRLKLWGDPKDIAAGIGAGHSPSQINPAMRTATSQPDALTAALGGA